MRKLKEQSEAIVVDGNQDNETKLKIIIIDIDRTQPFDMRSGKPSGAISI